MRTAEARDAWRRALERDRRFHLSRIRASGKAPLRNFDASLPNGITVVCGLNGAGKTTLLRLISSAFDEQLLEGDERPYLFEAGDFIVTVAKDQTELEFAAGTSTDTVRAGTHADAFAQCMRLMAARDTTQFW